MFHFTNSSWWNENDCWIFLWVNFIEPAEIYQMAEFCIFCFYLLPKKLTDLIYTEFILKNWSSSWHILILLKKMIYTAWIFMYMQSINKYPGHEQQSYITSKIWIYKNTVPTISLHIWFRWLKLCDNSRIIVINENAFCKSKYSHIKSIWYLCFNHDYSLLMDFLSKMIYTMHIQFKLM